MVHPYLDWFSNHIMLPFLEHFHDGEEFPVVDVVIPFSIIQWLGVISDQPIVSILFLWQDSSNCILASVCLDFHQAFVPSHSEYRSRCNLFIKCLLTFICPLEFCTFLVRLWSGLGQSLLSFFIVKKKGDAYGDLDGHICPVFRFSSKNSWRTWCSFIERGIILTPFQGPVPSFSLIAWSHCLRGGSSLKFSTLNTSQ